MTVEPPQGVKANLLRSFGTGGTGTITERMYEESCPEKSVEWKNLLFGLCFFNAVIHERKKYERLGWNIPYEFNDSDLEVSGRLTSVYLSFNISVRGILLGIYRCMYQALLEELIVNGFMWFHLDGMKDLIERLFNSKIYEKGNVDIFWKVCFRDRKQEVHFV